MSCLRFAPIVALLLAACASAPETSPVQAVLTLPQKPLKPVPAGELRGPATYSMLAVLLPSDRSADDVVAAIAEAARGVERPMTKETDDLASGAILVDVVPVERILSYEVIDFEALGIAAEEIARIKASRHAVSMVLAGPAEALAVVQREAADVARAAVRNGGWLFDGGTFQVFTRARFEEFRPKGFPLEVERLVTVMVDDSGAAARLETLGMSRLGLPELRMVDVPKTHLDGAIALFNAAAQLVVEQAYIAEAGELVIDLHSARLPHLRDLHAEAKKAGGGEAVTLAAFWEAQSPSDSDPVIRLDLEAATTDRATAFGVLLRRLFGAEIEAGAASSYR